jgi:hypothetical protein
MADQCGPQQKRIETAGGAVILPVGAVLSPMAPAGMTDAEAAAWLDAEMRKPLGGTWR